LTIISQIHIQGFYVLFRDLCKTPPFAQFQRQTQILSLEILNVFLHLKFSSSLNLNKIEHFSKVSFIHPVIEKIQNNELPDKIMINVHPQLWDDRFGPWLSELIKQNVKNVVKKLLIGLRN